MGTVFQFNLPSAEEGPNLMFEERILHLEPGLDVCLKASLAR